MRLRCSALSFSYGSLEVFKELDIDFPEKRVTAVLGPSGCGKTSLLHLISGVLSADSGSLLLEQTDEAEGKNGDRIGYLFQEPRLLPWKSVRRNVEIVLEEIYSAQQRRGIAEEFLGAVGLSDFLDYYPRALSGGMRQRVAIARAFAFPADLMLLDEPFQALDLRLKLELTRLFLRLWNKNPRTTVFVTHDIQEALVLGDRIIVLSDRPAEVVGEFENPLEAGRRSLSDEDIGLLERKLYALLAG
jgi:NitT/TauT family transport system ATP-binding protein